MSLGSTVVFIITLQHTFLLGARNEGMSGHCPVWCECTSVTVSSLAYILTLGLCWFGYFFEILVLFLHQTCCSKFCHFPEHLDSMVPFISTRADPVSERKRDRGLRTLPVLFLLMDTYGWRCLSFRVEQSSWGLQALSFSHLFPKLELICCSELWAQVGYRWRCLKPI